MHQIVIEEQIEDSSEDDGFRWEVINVIPLERSRGIYEKARDILNEYTISVRAIVQVHNQFDVVMYLQ